MGHKSKTRAEKQREASRRAHELHNAREERFKKQKEEDRRKARKIFAISAVVILFVIALGVYAWRSPGKYDGFAKCLTEKGAVMYGEDWCQYTNGQKAMFGKSFKYVNYVQKTGLETRPTWVIDGKEYPKVQSFERLSALTGCKY
ncbi:MAG: hypothetical protein ACE5DM_01365 [Candidatus Nanoarchaeia archaeon]